MRLNRSYASRGLSAQFIDTPEAKEFRETMALRAEQAGKSEPGETMPGRFAPILFAEAAAQ